MSAITTGGDRINGIANKNAEERYGAAIILRLIHKFDASPHNLSNFGGGRISQSSMASMLSLKVSSISLIFLSFQLGSGAFVLHRVRLDSEFLSHKQPRLCSRSPTQLSRCSVDSATAIQRWPPSFVEKVLSASHPEPESAAPFKKLEAPGPFERAIKKPAGTIAIIGSIKRTDPAFEKPINLFKTVGEISAALHDARVAAIAVWTDAELCTPRPPSAPIAPQFSAAGYNRFESIVNKVIASINVIVSVVIIIVFSAPFRRHGSGTGRPLPPPRRAPAPGPQQPGSRASLTNDGRERH